MKNVPPPVASSLDVHLDAAMARFAERSTFDVFGAYNAESTWRIKRNTASGIILMREADVIFKVRRKSDGVCMYTSERMVQENLGGDNWGSIELRGYMRSGEPIDYFKVVDCAEIVDPSGASGLYIRDADEINKAA